MKKFVGLCACTMGLAHTFMAAEAIQKAAEKKVMNAKQKPKVLTVFKTSLQLKILQELMLSYYQQLLPLKTWKDLKDMKFMK